MLECRVCLLEHKVEKQDEGQGIEWAANGGLCLPEKIKILEDKAHIS